MANNLKDHLKEVADAIRAKKGTSDLINPQDFATEIEGITSGSGGGEDSGASEWLYFDLANILENGLWQTIVTTFATYVKLQKEDWNYIGPVGVCLNFTVEEIKARIRAIGIDMNTKQNNSTVNNKEMSLREMESESGQSISDTFTSYGCIEITKEQFYDLNA